MNAINKELQAVKDKLSAQENNSGRLYLLDNPGELTAVTQAQLQVIMN